MLIQRTQYAPDGSIFARYAFHNALGQLHALKVNGQEVGKVILIGAVPGPNYRSVELTWDVEEISGEVAFIPDEIDDFEVEYMFNPARAVKFVSEAQ